MLVNDFLHFKKAMVESRELTQRTWNDYKRATDLLIEYFGRHRLVEDLAPSDFATLRHKLAKNWGPVTLGNMIQRIRSILKYAVDQCLTEKPIRFGQGFGRPTQKTLAIDRARKGEKLFAQKEIHALLNKASVHLRAMILLGVNCGLGNHDCGMLPISALNFDTRMLNFPRPKTGIPRRAALLARNYQCNSRLPCPAARTTRRKKR